MALTPERIDELAEYHGLDFTVYEPFARAIEAEVRKDDEAELEAIKSDLNDYMAAANAEANLATELLEQRTQDTALILQLVEALEGYRRNHNDTQPCDAERAGRAWLEGRTCA